MRRIYTMPSATWRTGQEGPAALPGLVTLPELDELQMPGGLPLAVDQRIYAPPKTYFSGASTILSNNTAFMRRQTEHKRKFR